MIREKEKRRRVPFFALPAVRRGLAVTKQSAGEGVVGIPTATRIRPSHPSRRIAGHIHGLERNVVGWGGQSARTSEICQMSVIDM